jgi:hypothetical protein
MNADQLRSIIDAGDKAALVRRLEADLDRFSPLIGADGPPDQPGPQEPYVRALQQSADDSVATALTEAIQVPLLAEASHLAESGQVRRPLLLYNLFSLLEAVRLPGVIDSLRVLRKFEKPLAAALVGNHDDLYAQLLIAHAVNQRGAPEDLRFWLGLLDHECIDYVSAGVVGLRESGHFNALCHLTKIKEAHRQHPELGSFDDEIMLLLDTYPEVNWDELVGEYDQAKTKTGAEADSLFAQAEEKLLAAEDLVTGSGDYNLACIAALRGQRDECRHWLQRSLAAGHLPSRQHLMADDDLRSVRHEPWFAELLSAARDEAG